MKRILCAGVFLSVIVVPNADPASAVVIRHDVADSSYRANAEDYPFLFALYRSREGFRDCVATVISDRWALTAAHCTEDKPFVQGMARGGFEVEVSGRMVMIDRVERHPATEDGKPVDLALLRFAKSVPHIRPAQIYRANDELGRDVLLPGWGTTGNGRLGLGSSDGIFRVAENRVDRAEGGWLTWVFDTPTSGRALALEGINGPGDSGGPALVMTSRGWATIGVSSGQRTYGRPEGIYGAEELYVRLHDHLGWIDRLTRGS